MDAPKRLAAVWHRPMCLDNILHLSSEPFSRTASFFLRATAPIIYFVRFVIECFWPCVMR